RHCLHGFYLENVIDTRIDDNTVSDGTATGFLLRKYAIRSIVSNNNIIDIGDEYLGSAFYLVDAHGWQLETNHVLNASFGIQSLNSANNRFIRNDIVDTMTGIGAWNSRSEVIRHNTIDGSVMGVAAQYSQIIAVSDNEFNAIGTADLFLLACISCSVKDNSMERGVLIWDHEYMPNLSYWTHDVTDNTIAEGRVEYLVGEEDRNIDPRDVGQLILVNCRNLSLSAAIIEDSPWGATIAYSEKCTLTDSEFRNNTLGGVYVSNSQDVVINGSVITENGQNALRFSGGVVLVSSDFSNITRNLIYHNIGCGIQMNESDDCFVHNNLIANNTGYGICIDGTNNLVYGNAIGWNDKGNAFCEGSGNTWHWSEMQLGNWWSDFEGGGAYSIEGPAESEDQYPQPLTNFALEVPISKEEQQDGNLPIEIAVISLVATLGVVIFALVVLHKKKWI
ncbi:hypothetical protein EU537_13150, partial [Candidatus Thorarchaeota archaeon]